MSNEIEVRGSFDKLRMTFLFDMVSVIVSAMVSLSNHEPSPWPSPLKGEGTYKVTFPVGRGSL